MSSYVFSRAERYAVFTVHREACWLCGEPVTLGEMQVDHIIPERLEETPELDAAKRELNLPDAFRINGFENWKPAHARCNRDKGGHVFKPSPLIQKHLEQASAKADRAAELRDSYLSDRKIDLAIEMLLTAASEKRLSPDQRTRMAELMAFHDSNRAPEDRGKPIPLMPGLTVVRDEGHVVLLQGPTGLVGIRPKGEYVDASWDCPNCGFTGWNGARCIRCQMLIDD